MSGKFFSKLDNGPDNGPDNGRDGGNDDTIYARASAAGRAGVAVFRLSGEGVLTLAERLVKKKLKPRHAVFCDVLGPDGETIDQGLAILFPGPHSFTGEDVLELHLHGSRAVEQELYEALNTMGARLAEAGEFTLRALKNNKLDLTQSEALIDLINSETNQQKKQALGQLEGGLSAHVEGWRGLLLKVLAPLAADIDFPDEGDVPAAIAAQAIPVIDELVANLKAAISHAAKAKIIREGASIVLMGAPNAGKSSLLNRLAGSDIAIVSDQPGTTRDVVETRLDLDGFLVNLADTAGLRDISDDAIEREGMRRTFLKVEDADIKIFVVDALDLSQDLNMKNKNVSRETFHSGKSADIIVLNKIDLLKEDIQAETLIEAIPTQSGNTILLSSKTGNGVEGLLLLIKAILASQNNQQDSKSATGILTRQRHVEAINIAIDALMRARDKVSHHPELAAEDLRLANRSFARLLGVVDVEDVLGEIFSNFCIGK